MTRARALLHALAAGGVASTSAAVSAAEPPFSLCAWIVDDGTRVRPSDRPPRGAVCVDLEHPAVAGRQATEPDDAVARDPGDAGRLDLVALRAETVAWQIALHAGRMRRSGLRATLSLPAAPAIGSVETFVEPTVPVRSRTRTDRAEDTLAWASPAARPDDRTVLGALPDPLLPTESAPRWFPYPLILDKDQTTAVWFDFQVSDEAPAGRYEGRLEIAADPGLALTLPFSITIKAARLPFAAARAMLYYDPQELTDRLGATTSGEPHLWQVLHAHHVAPLLSADSVADVARLADALCATAFGSTTGSRVPTSDEPAVVLGLGTYGSLGAPSPRQVALVGSLLDELERVRHTCLNAPAFDRFLYAVDEKCDSDRAARWRTALDAAPSAAAPRLPVAETCGKRVPARGADIVMVPPDAYRARDRRRAEAGGKQVWLYNGQRPFAGSMVLDVPPTDLRANGWIAAAFAIPRWFYWESTFWNDDHAGGHGPLDPFLETETFHSRVGDTALGDGLLLYPGRQADWPAHSAGLDGVLPSIRLKNLRRGVQDAGYVVLAASGDIERTEAIVRRVVPAALDEARPDQAAAWPADGARYEQARRELWHIVPDGAALARPDVDRLLADVAHRRATQSIVRLRRAAAAVLPHARFAQLTSRRLLMACLAGLATTALGIIRYRRKKRE